MIYPDWKYKLAVKNQKEGVTPRDKDVFNLIKVLDGSLDSKKASQLTKEALYIYKNDAMLKEVLEACLLCEDQTTQDISDITGIPMDVVEVYKHFFFDLGAFRYRLHKYEYVRTYKSEEFPDASLYKSWALSTGIHFFKWKFKVNGHSLLPKEVLTDLVGDTFFRAKEHINEPITSAVTRESLKWLKQASDSIMAIQKVSDGGNKDKEILSQFHMALEHKDYTVKGDDISDAEII